MRFERNTVGQRKITIDGWTPWSRERATKLDHAVRAHDLSSVRVLGSTGDMAGADLLGHETVLLFPATTCSISNETAHSLRGGWFDGSMIGRTEQLLIEPRAALKKP